MVIAEPCNVGDCHTADAGDLVMVATLPIWAGTGGVAAEAAIFDVGVPAITTGARTGWAQFLRWLGLGACADGNCGNEIQAANRVFWSGGQTAKNAAEAWARANNAVTLEMTETGQRLEETTKSLDWFTQARPQWVAVSERFAAGAAGEVHVFHTSAGIRLQSIWATVENQVLMANPNVTRIIYHVIMPDGSDIIVMP